MGIGPSKSALERFWILFIDWALSHDFIVVKRSQFALFIGQFIDTAESHWEIRLLHWRVDISRVVHHNLVAVDGVSSLLITTSEVILRFLVIGYEARAVLLLRMHGLLGDHMV